MLMVKTEVGPTSGGQFDNIYDIFKGFPGGTSGKEPICQCWRHKETQVQYLGQEDPLEEGKATQPSILALRICETDEPGGLHSP